jgi:hypothetical protein
MDKKNPPSRLKNFFLLLSLIIILIVVAFGVWIVYNNYNLSKTGKSSAATTSSPVTYDGGKAIPADSQARAKSAGYYCPSWDATPGKLSALFCVKLDN